MSLKIGIIAKMAGYKTLAIAAGIGTCFLLLARCSTAKSLRIGIIGDQTGVDMSALSQVAANLDQSYKTLGAAVELLKRRNVAGILHIGDVLEDSQASDEKSYDALFDKVAGILDRSGVHWFLTPGDHDVNPPGDLTVDSSKHDDEGYFQRAYARRQPAVSKTLYYSFDIGNFHFIALDSLEHLRADPRWGDVYLSQLSSAQFEWLHKDLDLHRDAPGIIVFTHQPLWYNSTGWLRVHTLLRRYPVKAVLAGHFHYSQDEGALDGIRYLVVGATGADVKQGSPSSGNLQHVTVLTLRSGGVPEIESLPVAPLQGSNGFAPRADMDRVQAVDVMLDNFYSKYYEQFSGYNPLCVIDGQVYSSPQRAAPVVRLLPVGNPVDVPLQVTVTLTSPGWSLENPKFDSDAKDGCVAQADQSCVLVPGRRIYSSNNSAVTEPMTPPVKPEDNPAPLWQSGLRPMSPPVTPNTPVTFELRVSFQGEKGRYELSRTLRTATSRCGPNAQKK